MPTTQQFDNATLIDNPFSLQSREGTLSSKADAGIYKVSVSSSSNSLNARLSLTNLTGNALLNLYDGSRNLITTSNQPSRLAESIISNNIAAGTYYIEVGLDSDPSATSASYKLNVEFNTTGEFTNIFWRNLNSQQAAIWQMSGNTRVDGVAFNGLDAGWEAQGFNDLNGDGEDDVVWQNRNSGDVAFWFVNNTQLAADSAVVNFGVPLSWRITNTGHLNPDKFADLIWQEASSGNAGMWLMQGKNRLDAQLQPSAAGWAIQQVGDLNNDGQDDLVWRNSASGQLAFILMNGKDVAERGTVISIAPEWKIQFLADLDGNGTKDIVWRNSQTGDIALWTMDGLTFQGAVIKAGLNVEVQGVGDFNGDGKADLFLRNTQTGENSISLMNGLTTISNNPLLSVGGDWKVEKVSDFNGDGKDDLLWRSNSSGAVAVWMMDGTANTVDRLKNSNGVVDNTFYSGVDASWTIQSVLHRNLTAQPFSISGAAPETAFDIGVLDDTGAYKDKISPNENDFYKFSVGIQSDLTASLTQAGTLELYKNINGTWTQQTYTAGATLTIEKGDYYIKVSAAANVTTATDYTLNIQGVPRRIDLVGTAFTSQTSYALSDVPQTGSPADNKVDVAFQIKNLETFAASDFTVSFYISRDTEINPNDTTPIRGDRQLDIFGLTGNTTQATISGKDLLIQKSLSKNGTFDGSVTLTLPGSLDGFWTVDKDYYIGMAINLSGLQNETNPNDNYNVALSKDKSAINITNVPTTDLEGASLTGASNANTFQQGSNVNLTYAVENLGNKPTSKDVAVSFYASLDPIIEPGKDYQIDFELLTQTIGTKSSTGNLSAIATLPTKAQWNDIANLFGKTQIYLGMYVNSDITSGPTESDTTNNLNRGMPYDLLTTYIDLGSQS
jgi:hypothetical protein